jgi:transaldolase
MSKIFLDSCDHLQTKKAIAILSKLDGQTTNPTLLVKNPEVAKLTSGGKISLQTLLEHYKIAVTQISKLIPEGSVSIEVYAQKESTVPELLKQAEEFYQWIPNAHIKFPITKNGLLASQDFVNNGGRVNMTLVFTQEQALAVYLATKNMKKKGDVFVSPFVGRLDDIGIKGLDLITNIVRMYKETGSKVEVLSASLRSMNHLDASIKAKADIVTCPLSLIEEYSGHKNITTPKDDLLEIPYKNLTATSIDEVNIHHNLTEFGLERFVNDWKNILQ